MAFTARGIDPIRSWPSANSTSVPLIRGEPSRRSVAIVRCLREDIDDRTRAAKSGAAASNSDQLAT
jgi:hypothetical protein